MKPAFWPESPIASPGTRHGSAGTGEQPPAAFSAIEVVDRIRGNEVFFEPDREPATLEEIDQAIRLLRCSRSDLLAELEGAHDELLDWDPPYRRFASWASWRTIRATLAHIANCETHYYLRGIGYRSPSAPASPQDHWRVALSHSRDEAFEFLTHLKSANDSARVSAAGGEHWSVRKALRRMVWHELLHLKSIRRITDEYQRRERVMRRDVR